MNYENLQQLFVLNDLTLEDKNKTIAPQLLTKADITIQIRRSFD
jgi:hypothetical protein